ncbi:MULTISPECIES: thioredoxin domain-containing protein [Gluconobacter]|uniref:thioredoxin domain-containing protein n=1 Tax=Gluconobacter TaxID=441 RepID=UPI00062C28C7|nr:MULTISPECIES: thioredoxin domain-containing protein [Gluconobacter]
MTLGRRAFLVAGPALAAVASFSSAHAEENGLPSTDPRMGPRVLGSPDAKVQVDEWFSLTCSHCAHFAQTIFPQIKTNLIDTGKIRYRYHDFPLDQVALLAAMLARSLPADRYAPFVDDLLRTQDQWAFAQNIDPIQELKKRATLAGISAAEFDRINTDNALREAIVNRQDRDGAFLQIQGTPYFRINDVPAPDVVSSYDAFAKAVAKAS